MTKEELLEIFIERVNTLNAKLEAVQCALTVFDKDVQNERDTMKAILTKEGILGDRKQEDK